MSVDVTAQVHVARPKAEVAAFMFDPKNDKLWTSGVVECTPKQEGLLTTGAEVERVSAFLGKKLSYLIKVVDAAPEQFVEMTTEDPFPMRVRYDVEDDDQGTRVSIRTQGGGTGFFKVAAPFLSKMVKRSIQKDLENLKQWLEQR